MELSEWLKKNGMSAKCLADKAKIGSATLYKALEQKRGVTRRVASLLSKATKGEITIVEAMCPEKHVILVDCRKNNRKRRPIYCKSCGVEVKPPRSWHEDLTIRKEKKCKK